MLTAFHVVKTVLPSCPSFAAVWRGTVFYKVALKSK